MKRLQNENSQIDAVDARLLRLLAADGRKSVAELARVVGLSAPSVAERIRRLDDAGVITGFGARIDPARLGRPLAALIRIRPMPGQLKKVVQVIEGIAAITACDRVTGEDCFIARAHLLDVDELEAVIDKIIPYAMTNTSIIQSSPIVPRLPPLPE
jgi:Lrp/AsnC family transcriptional regulator, leucine-responsive regulatory protein